VDVSERANRGKKIRRKGYLKRKKRKPLHQVKSREKKNFQRETDLSLWEKELPRNLGAGGGGRGRNIKKRNKMSQLPPQQRGRF